MSTQDAAYWDQIIEDWEPTTAHRLWRAHSDAINVQLLRRWLPDSCGRLLKTDLFDEAVSAGLYPELARRADVVVGIDLSAGVVREAQKRAPRLEAHVASVLDLPFADASFDVVVSNSTLDHFASLNSLRDALGEISRVIRRDGLFVVTVDNRLNPVVALRTSRLLAAPLRQLGVVPYYVGATCGYRTLGNLLRDSDFDVRETIAMMHCPPKIAAELAQRHANTERDAELRRHLRRALRFERMARWPTSHLTGHFVAARAVKQ